MAREEGLKYREIADKLNLSVKTVEAQMSLALKQLRESLKEFHPNVLFFMLTGKGISGLSCQGCREGMSSGRLGRIKKRGRQGDWETSGVQLQDIIP
jgi:hypothetical protein